MKKLVRVLATVAALVLIPAAAGAVTASSGNGNGNQKVVSWLTNGWSASGTLRSTSGHPVYPSGKAVVSGPDQVCGRYASDTRSASYVTRRGSCSHHAGYLQDQGMQWRVCRNLNNLPDPCGDWSATVKR